MTSGIKAEIYDDFDLFEAAGAGAIIYCEDSAIMKCPGCGMESCCTERADGRSRPSWIMDKTTQSWQPSVHHEKGCGWHGFLTNGYWVSV